MAHTYLQSISALLKVSIDAGVTYKTIVCLSSWNFNGTTAVNREETQCGVLVGLGANEWGFDVDAVVDLTPTGASEVSWEDLLGMWNAQTLLLIRSAQPDPAGTDWYLQGSAYITNVTLTAQVGNNVKFNMTVSGSGALDVTP